MRPFEIVFISIAISTLSLGCGRSDLPVYTKLGELRVLAIKASLPEASVGSSVTVTPVLSDIEGHSRNITYTVEGCSDPGVGFGATPSCAGSSTQATLGAGTVSLAGPGFTAAAAAVTFTIPSGVATGRSTLELLNGVGYLVVFSFSVPGQTLTAFKRLVVSTNPVKNSNPILSDLRTDGGSLLTLPLAKVTVTPVLDAPESYRVYTSTGSTEQQTEVQTVTWFVSEGSWERQRTSGSEPNGFSPGARADDHSIVVVGVARDGRGGEDYLIRNY